MRLNSGRQSSSSRGIFAEIVRLQQAGRRGALATPLRREGSAPMSWEARLLLRDDGSALGTIGGGELEAEVVQAAGEVMAGGVGRVVEFEMNATEAAESGMICGGRCAVLVEPVEGSEEAAFAEAARAEAEGEAVALVRVMDGGRVAKRLAVFADGRMVGGSGDGEVDEALEGLCRSALRDGMARSVEEPVPAHITPLLPHPTVCIFGGGHVGAVLAHLAEVAGFRVVVVDDREEFANRQRFPTAERVLAAPVEEAFRELGIGAESYVVAVTRGHRLDGEVVAEALGTSARYVGMIGSRRKVAEVKRQLGQRGFSEEALARLHAPIGLDIGADTVEEIAVSIAAELIAVRRGGG